MALIYRFKKEKLDNGMYIERPRIMVNINGFEIPALIDTGCDVTVIPESLAEVLNILFTDRRDKIFGFLESTDVLQSKANFTFLAKAQRNNVLLRNIPVLIALTEQVDNEITLGLKGVFDAFDINFKKATNRIVFKKAIT